MKQPRLPDSKILCNRTLSLTMTVKLTVSPFASFLWNGRFPHSAAVHGVRIHKSRATAQRPTKLYGSSGVM
jgi:hypothetical protein